MNTSFFLYKLPKEPVRSNETNFLTKLPELLKKSNGNNFSMELSKKPMLKECLQARKQEETPNEEKKRKMFMLDESEGRGTKKKV